MTGLEQIVDQIKQEAMTASNEKLEATKLEAKQIIENTKKDIESSTVQFQQQVEQERKQLELRGNSAAQLQKRKRLLQAKQEMIQQIFDDSIETMLHMNEKDYFSLLLRMVDRYALNEPGTIQMSEQDIERMPESFHEELTKRNIIISDQSAKVNGGFLLNYGDIEENCSFEALIAVNREKLQDQIVAMIF